MDVRQEDIDKKVAELAQAAVELDDPAKLKSMLMEAIKDTN